MANEKSKRDSQRVTSLLALDSSSGELIALTADGTSKRLKVDALITTGLSAQTGVVDNEVVDAADTGCLILGTDSSNYQILAVDTSGNLKITGEIAHDAADSGSPHKMGGRADTTFQAAAADGDRVNALFDVYGVQEVRIDHPNKWSFHSDGSAALTDTSVQAAPGAGLSIYVTDIIFSTGAATACNIFFEEGATKVLGPYYLEAVAGRGVVIHLSTPKKITANTALTVTTSAAIAQSLDVNGFLAP